MVNDQRAWDTLCCRLAGPCFVVAIHCGRLIAKRCFFFWIQTRTGGCTIFPNINSSTFRVYTRVGAPHLSICPSYTYFWSLMSCNCLNLFSTWCCALSCLLSYWTLPCLLSYWTLYSLVKGVAKSSTVREFLDTLSPDRLQHLKGRIYYSRQGKWELGKEKELKRSSKGKYAYGSPLFFALLSSFSVFCFL